MSVLLAEAEAPFYAQLGDAKVPEGRLAFNGVARNPQSPVTRTTSQHRVLSLSRIIWQELPGAHSSQLSQGGARSHTYP